MVTRGGKREGAGRPSTGSKPNRTFRLDDDEYAKVKAFIKLMRSGKDVKPLGTNQRGAKILDSEME